MAISIAITLLTALWIQAPHPLIAALAGQWTGTLEYRDYRSERRVTLPTKLLVTQSASVLEFAYEYDDGPGKTVRSRDRVTIDASAATYRVQNSDGTYDATFAINGLAGFGKGSDTVVLIGKGTENDAPVDLRITLSVTPKQITMERESRKAGEEWMFRNRYVLTR